MKNECNGLGYVVCTYMYILYILYMYIRMYNESHCDIACHKSLSVWHTVNMGPYYIRSRDSFSETASFSFSIFLDLPSSHAPRTIFPPGLLRFFLLSAILLRHIRFLLLPFFFFPLSPIASTLRDACSLVIYSTS